MNPSSDPATLYAACAAAAGALVAIMGGFLISWVVGLLAQKEGLELRRRELQQRSTLAEESFEAIQRERSSVSADWFDKAHLQEIVAAGGEVDVEAVVDDSRYIGTTRDEMSALVERRVEQVRAAVVCLEAAVPNGPIGRDWADLGVDVPVDEEDIWLAVAAEITKQRGAQRPRQAWEIALSSVHVTTPDIVYQRQDQRIRDERAAAAQLAALNAEIELVDSELRRMGGGVPRLLVSIGILAYFALGSVALPVALLTRNHVTDSSFARWGVFGLFASGLGLLILFLVVSAWPLRHRKAADEIEQALRHD